MILIIHGKIEKKDERTVILECDDVRCPILTSKQAFAVLPSVGQECWLWVLMVETEEKHVLISFANKQERICFQQLLSVAGCGIDDALSIVNGMPPQILYRSIKGKDISAIAAIKGIGEELAQRILSDFEENADAINLDNAPAHNDIISECRRAEIEGAVYLCFQRKEVLDALGNIECRQRAEAAMKRALIQILCK